METMWATIGAALISAAAAILVSVIQHRKSTALIEYKVDELKKEVEKHNNLVERTYILEDRINLNEEKIKVANHRIEDLERRVER